MSIDKRVSALEAGSTLVQIVSAGGNHSGKVLAEGLEGHKVTVFAMMRNTVNGQIHDMFAKDVASFYDGSTTRLMSTLTNFYDETWEMVLIVATIS